MFVASLFCSYPQSLAVFNFTINLFPISLLWQFTDEEAEHAYEEFYEDVHTEFLKFGEIINFKVLINHSQNIRYLILLILSLDIIYAHFGTPIVAGQWQSL